MIQKMPRWVLIAGGLLAPAVAFAAVNASSGVCGSWCSVVFGCGG